MSGNNFSSVVPLQSMWPIRKEGENVLRPYDKPPNPIPYLQKDQRSSALYTIKSTDRVSGTSSSFTVNFTNTSWKNIRKVKLVQAAIPATFYNVRTGVNSFFSWETSANGPYATNIPPGYYTGTTLAAAIQAAMRAVDLSNQYTVTYSATTGYFTYGFIGGGFPFRFDFTLGTAGSGYYSQANLLMGFPLGNVYPSGSPAINFTSQQVAALYYPFVLNILIPQLYPNIQSAVNGERGTFQIPANHPSGMTPMTYNANTAYEQSVVFGNPYAVDELTVSLFFPVGTGGSQSPNYMEPVNLNGGEWQMTFELDFW